MNRYFVTWLFSAVLFTFISIETSLALIALTRTPQLGTSHKESLASAADWIRRCAPVSDSERLAVTIALSGLYTRDSRNINEEDSVRTADFSKIVTLLRDVDGQQDSVWHDALSLTKLPDGIATPKWAINDKATRDKYRKQQAIPLATQDDYLKGYLHAIVKSWNNDSNMEKLALAIQSKQNNDAQPTVSTNNDIGAAALVILHPTVFQKTAHLFFSDPVKE